jgi:hypothetical protein
MNAMVTNGRGKIGTAKDEESVKKRKSCCVETVFDKKTMCWMTVA